MREVNLRQESKNKVIKDGIQLIVLEEKGEVRISRVRILWLR
jgi:hypothetical protein